jgi:SAM-dependent methyltransferase
MSDSYCIKPGYTPNRHNVTLDEVSGDTYWNEQRILASESYQYQVYEYAARVAREHGVRTIVDIGCGSGRKLRMLHRAVPSARIIGIDQEPAIEFCRREYDFGEWMVENLELPSGALQGMSVDLIVCSDVIEHLLDPDVLLSYISDISTEGTLTVLSTPERDQLRGPDNLRPDNPQHIREWNRTELRAYLALRGFDVVEHILQLPVRIALNRIFYSQVVRRALRSQPLRNNQVCLMRRAGG